MNMAVNGKTFRSLFLMNNDRVSFPVFYTKEYLNTHFENRTGLSYLPQQAMSIVSIISKFAVPNSNNTFLANNFSQRHYKIHLLLQYFL